MSKSELIRSLQSEEKALSPFDISQRIRIDYGCVSVYKGDPDLPIEAYRGFMIRFAEKPNRSAKDPELYTCTISLRQTKPWQDLVWTKEILQILDNVGHRTGDRDALGHLLEMQPQWRSNGTPLNVRADMNGLALALGATIPHAYRTILRQQNFIQNHPPAQLEQVLLVPAEFLAWVMSEQFEADFEKAIIECD